MRKWEAIDDEIWAKVIVLERNRRVAKVSFPVGIQFCPSVDLNGCGRELRACPTVLMNTHLSCSRHMPELQY